MSPRPQDRPATLPKEAQRLSRHTFTSAVQRQRARSGRRGSSAGRVQAVKVTVDAGEPHAGDRLLPISLHQLLTTPAWPVVVVLLKSPAYISMLRWAQNRHLQRLSSHPSVAGPNRSPYHVLPQDAAGQDSAPDCCCWLRGSAVTRDGGFKLPMHFPALGEQASGPADMLLMQQCWRSNAEVLTEGSKDAAARRPCPDGTGS